MKGLSSALLAAVGLTVTACDIPFMKKDAADTTAATTDTVATRPAAPVDTMPPDTAPAAPVTPPAAAQPSPRPVPTTPLMDEPYTPTDTGTVAPGMSREEVVAIWGVPVAERMSGAWTYLYYRNGCEVTCGTFDVVFLQDGQVVDAIVRGPGHTYAGVSSSPPDRQAEPTLPAGTMSS